MLKTLVLALVVLSGCATANYKWSASNKAMATTTVMTMGLDYVQTLGITNDCRETNPVMGPCGNNVHPSVYFPVVTVAALVAAHALPSKMRTIALGVLTGVELANGYRNHAYGY